MSRVAPGRVARVLRAIATAGFAASLGSLATASAIARSDRGTPSYPHHYPKDSLGFERPKVSGAAPRAPRATTLIGPLRIRSLAQLAEMLPRGTLRADGPTAWRLTAPVDVTQGATLVVDHAKLMLGPRTFLQARHAGSLIITHSSVGAVNNDGQPESTVTPSRGFISARDGGRLVLRSDTISDLGHLATMAYGISLRDPAPRSAIVATTIRGNYFGIFLSHARGVSIVANDVLDSRVYGIDPYGGSSNILIAQNLVAGSGLHGIVLADRVSRVRVLFNRVSDVRAHGIVIFGGATENTVRGNRITKAFDGIVVTRSSRNSIAENVIDRVERFGLRISNGSAANSFRRNTIVHALLGAYFYGGAAGNSLLGTTFSDNRENVRVRVDAPDNDVRPWPSLSERR